MVLVPLLSCGSISLGVFRMGRLLVCRDRARAVWVPMAGSVTEFFDLGSRSGFAPAAKARE
jgi:hypothetical protein